MGGQWLDLIVETTDSNGDPKETELLNYISGMDLYAHVHYEKRKNLWIAMYLVKHDTDEETSLSDVSFVVYDIGKSEKVWTKGFKDYSMESRVTAWKDGGWQAFSGNNPNDEGKTDNLDGAEPTKEQKKKSATIHFENMDQFRFKFEPLQKGGTNFIAGVSCPTLAPPTPPTPDECSNSDVSFDFGKFKVFSKTAGRFKKVLKSSGQWLDLIVETTDSNGDPKETELLNYISGMDLYAHVHYEKRKNLWIAMYLVKHDTDEETSLSDVSFAVYDIGKSEKVWTKGFKDYSM